MDEKNSKAEEWKMRKKLEKMITPEVAKEYKVLALFNCIGIGMAETTQKWHENLASFLEKIIRSDDEISNYVEGKFQEDESNEPLFPESDFTISAVKDKLMELEMLDPERSIYPEQFLPYMGQVELLIQKICCKYIKDAMLPRMIPIYGKAFLWDEPTMVSQK